jgi:hypothetical protein
MGSDYLKPIQISKKASSPLGLLNHHDPYAIGILLEEEKSIQGSRRGSRKGSRRMTTHSKNHKPLITTPAKHSNDENSSIIQNSFINERLPTPPKLDFSVPLPNPLSQLNIYHHNTHFNHFNREDHQPCESMSYEEFCEIKFDEGINIP